MQGLETEFKNAINNDLDFSSKSFTSLFKLKKIKPIDNYGNTLLHITTEHSNSKCVEDLLNAEYDPNLKNKFGKSAWDIAIANQNKEVLSKFVDHRIKTATGNLQKELVDLEMKNKKLSSVIVNYETTNSDKSKEIVILTRSKTSLLNEISTLKNSIVDIQNDNLVLKNTNKRLREENEDLTISNKKLKSSVDALITASMQ